MRIKKTKPWSNYGNGVQMYDVCVEVDKLDTIRLAEGKDTDKYKSQHKRVLNLISQYNAEGSGTINIRQCRTVVQRRAEFPGERTTFFNKQPYKRDSGDKDGK